MMRRSSSKRNSASRVVVLGDNDEHFPDNTIRNTKYTLLNFIPLNLYDQFHLPMNMYFLLIALLQLWGEVTAANPWTTWIPLIFIFAVSAVREACDDIKRSKSDKIANSKLVHKVSNGSIIQVPCASIRVGDKDEEIPCDMVLLHTSNNGKCFIQTANIDGETNLKVRYSPTEAQQVFDDPATFSVGGLRVECPPPDCHIYKFDSRMYYNKKTISLSSANLLLQVTRLKDTEFVYGLCVYTGNETKFGMNKEIPPPKVTKFDKYINYFSIIIFIIQLVLALIWGIIGLVEYNHSLPWYLSRQSLLDNAGWIVYPLRFLLLNSSMIPISLKVTMEIAKVAYSMFIEHDQEFNRKEKNVYYNSSYLAEGLGQVKYIFTDKTGTLTKNQMKLKQIYVNRQTYNIEKEYIKQEDQEKEETIMFLRNILVNNTLKVMRVQAYTFSGESPEEVCTVEAITAGIGTLHTRTDETIIIDLYGKEEKYKIIHVQEFSSDRKRTSIIVYSYTEQRYLLLLKGADDIVLQKAIDIYKAPNKESDMDIYTALDRFSSKGLRTLAYGYRYMTETEVSSMLKLINEAETALVNRDIEKAKVYDLFEKDIYICGATGIEDELQDHVYDSIKLLKAANIHIWMITGDKPKTAMEIGKNTGIVNRNIPDENLLFLEGNNLHDISSLIDTYISMIKTKRNDMCVYVSDDTDNSSDNCFSLVVSGYTLVSILQNYTYQDIYMFKKLHKKGDTYIGIDIENNKDDLQIYTYCRFYELCLLMDSVVCSRVTPKQKSEIVSLVKCNCSDICLSIGDGGNDVNMIQNAHIGVGIEGKEGKQAARASDYVLSTFHYLPRLLLYHGYNSYRRSSYIGFYSYFKSIMFCIIQTLYNMTSFFSGLAIFNSLYMASYNVILFIPIMAFVTDKYFVSQTLEPSLYIDTQENKFFNLPRFIYWFILGVFMSIISFTLCGVLFPASSFDELGIQLFMNNLLVQDIVMLLFVHSTTSYMIICILISHILFLLATVILSNIQAFSGFVPYQSFQAAYGYIVTYINKPIAVLSTLLLFFICRSIVSTYKPPKSKWV
ncbi:hypothetical protein WA158_007287 [Blastocystis sp. Blastoise]